MIRKYLENLDAFIIGNPAIAKIKILRRDYNDTGLEKIALYRYRLTLLDDSIIEVTERLLQIKSNFDITKYRYHWQSSSGKLIKRWDNAPHHKEIDTFPDHLHDGSDGNVVRYENIPLIEILKDILKTIRS